MKNLLEFLLFKIIASLFFFISWNNCTSVGKILGNFIFLALKSRRLIAIENLKFAFPNKNQYEINLIAKESFQSISISFLEILKISSLSENKLKKIITIKNPENLESLLNPLKSCIILSSHFGNWELLASALKIITKRKTLILVQKQRNTFVDNFLNRNRKMFGCEITYLDDAPKNVLKNINENNFIAMIADQSARREELQIDFFNRTAPTHRGPAIFSLKSDIPIIFIILKRIGIGKYELLFEKINSENLIGTNEEKIIELTSRHVQVLEKYIIETPNQWLWGHKRWKHTI